MINNAELLPKSNILVVDDTPDNLRVLSSIFKVRGYEVRKALDAKMALIACEKLLPDIILLDINMPEMNGYQLCEYLKSRKETQDIPIIFISALTDAFDIVKGFKCGGSDYITKPFHVEEVVVRVENQLTLQRLQMQLKKQNSRLREEIKKRRYAEQALQEANERLQQIACLDGLTAISNRRHFNDCLNREWLRAAREQFSLSLILCDVDYFKLYNDAYGHLAGDTCLHQIAQAIKAAIKRPADLVARYGGEEFVVLLPNTNLAGAEQVARNIQFEVQQLKISHSHSRVSNFITVSLGISAKNPYGQQSPEILIKEADNALYRAKEEGRNRYCAYLEHPLSLT
ncbi:PleD family two-component system response regulator [Ancylothrix sp. C2]|uniref:GGDEF domain-containing response regulator n=1 Tax=Ancylothrix sp. D3o TaxID=2953691 RepID=UPI0021BAE0D2|nr:PleD family two-component system response regulator [Ancylothrix sp. D3o]MCT7950572.1 PleD family two-component system response regulator [Ancylothrix sp. D3o]